MSSSEYALVKILTSDGKARSTYKQLGAQYSVSANYY